MSFSSSTLLWPFVTVNNWLEKSRGNFWAYTAKISLLTILSGFLIALTIFFVSGLDVQPSDTTTQIQSFKRAVHADRLVIHYISFGMVTPLLETFLIAALLFIYRKLLQRNHHILAGTALTISALHALSPAGGIYLGLIVFIPFLLMSHAYMTWRNKSFIHGFSAAFIPHCVNNSLAFVIRSLAM